MSWLHLTLNYFKLTELLTLYNNLSEFDLTFKWSGIKIKIKKMINLSAHNENIQLLIFYIKEKVTESQFYDYRQF